MYVSTKVQTYQSANTLIYLLIYIRESAICTITITPHALKGQKLLAQGSALGITIISKAPCKGKSFLGTKVQTYHSTKVLEYE